jgi:hypothetical protein
MIIPQATHHGIIRGGDTMFCNNCGTPITQNARFCPACGKTLGPGKMTQDGSVNLNGNVQSGTVNDGFGGSIGYSARISDPAFARYIKNSNSWSAIFSLILAVAAIAGFYLSGRFGSTLENPQALYIGLAIGGMFILIAFFQIIGRKRSKTWDGTVIDKKIEKKREKHYNGSEKSDYYWEDYLQYNVIVRSQEGKIVRLSAKDDDTVYNYYQVGDHVRHHGGLNSYEKYDKSRDSIVFCNACGSLNEISSEQCFRCKCPLLK